MNWRRVKFLQHRFQADDDLAEEIRLRLEFRAQEHAGGGRLKRRPRHRTREARFRAGFRKGL